MRRHASALSAGVIALACSATTGAAGNDGLARCVALTEDVARLACYDALFRDGGSLSAGAARIAPAPAVTASAEPVLTPEQSFGRAKREQARERAAAAAVEPSEMRAEIAGVETRDQGRVLVLRLANGQVWQQMERITLPTVRTGDQLLIERGMLGSYLARLNGRAPSFRVKRLK